MRDACLEQADLLDQQWQGRAQQRRDGAVWIGQHAPDLLDADARARRDHDAELTTEAAQRLKQCGGIGRISLVALDVGAHDDVSNLLNEQRARWRA